MPKRRKCPNPACGEPVLVSTATVCSACHRRFSEFEAPVKPATASLFGEDEVEVNEVVRPKRVPRKIARKKMAESDGSPSLFDTNPLSQVDEPQDSEVKIDDATASLQSSVASPVVIADTLMNEPERSEEGDLVAPFAVHASESDLNEATIDSPSSSRQTPNLGERTPISSNHRPNPSMTRPSRSQSIALGSVSWSGFAVTLICTTLVCLVIGLLFWRKISRQNTDHTELEVATAVREPKNVPETQVKTKVEKSTPIKEVETPTKDLQPKPFAIVTPKTEPTGLDLLRELQESKNLREIHQVGVFSTLIDSEVLEARDWLHKQNIKELQRQTELGDNYFEWDISGLTYTLQQQEVKNRKKINLDALYGVSRFHEHPIWNYPGGSKEGMHTFYVIAKDAGLEKTSLGVNWLWVSTSVHNDQPYHCLLYTSPSPRDA